MAEEKIQRSDAPDESVEQKGSAGQVANEGIVTDGMLGEQERRSGGPDSLGEESVGRSAGAERPDEVRVPQDAGDQADAYTEGAPDDPPEGVTPDQRDAVAGRARESDKRAAE